MNEKYEEIMQEITAGLTGDPQADMEYLKSKSDEYKTHELSKEILRGVGRLMYEVLPPEKRSEWEKLMENESLGVNAAIEEARFQMHKQNPERALEILESLIKKIEDENGELLSFRDDSVSEYRNFQNFFEDVLYKEMFKPEKTVRKMNDDYCYLYFIYGNILFEVKNYDAARVALNKALRLNPLFSEAIFELAETYKINSEWDDYLTLTKRCLSVAYRAHDVARCYRNYGYYYIEQKEYELAAALYFKSMQFDNQSQMPQSQLFYIQQVSGKQIPQFSYDEVKKLLESNGIQPEVNPLILSIAYGLGKMTAEEGNVEAAQFFLSILYDLTHDEEIKEMMDNLPSA